jgi:hypothetical protein
LATTARASILGDDGLEMLLGGTARRLLGLPTVP